MVDIPAMKLDFSYLSASESQAAATDFYEQLRQRRSVRNFSEKQIPEGVIESCILAAGTAPNGANLQPWHFAVAQSMEIKRAIREAAEKEERAFYGGRAPQDWLDSLAHLGTDANKPFLEIAPALIAIFQKSKTNDKDGEETKTYYPKESVGIATGMLITALHHAGIATLTHTPSPMQFLTEIFKRPKSEKPFLLLVCGYPAPDCEVPNIEKLPLGEISSFH